jgi:hypothetical protein
VQVNQRGDQRCSYREIVRHRYHIPSADFPREAPEFRVYRSVVSMSL